MDNSDDYFTDDIFLDEQAIATLDAEESKYILSHPRPTVAEPPPKRQKTATGWNAPPPPNRTASIEDLDLPEISVRGGFYGLHGLSQSQSQRPASQQMGTQRAAAAAPPIGANIPLPRSRIGSQVQASQHVNSRQPPRRPPRALSRSQSHPASSQGLSRQGSNASASSVFRNTPHNSQQHRNLVSIIENALNPNHVPEDVQTVRSQLEAMQKTQAEMQSSLEAAINDKRSKAGEVAILRQNMEKLNQSHLAEQARLRAAKEAAEAMQQQIRREMKEEIERLKTQYTFQKHELETSGRKPLVPACAGGTSLKRPARGLSIPVAGPSHYAKTIGQQTPTRTRAASPPARRPRTTQPLPPPPPSKKAKKQQAALPGFVNAFLPSSPEKVRDKGKGRERESTPLFARTPSQQMQWDMDVVPPPSPPSSPVPMAGKGKERAARSRTRPVATGPPRVHGMQYSDNMPSEDAMELDADMTMDGVAGMEVKIQNQEPLKVAAEVFEEPEIQDWANRLHHIIFTHTFPPNLNTFQTLLSESSGLATDAVAYSAASSMILETLGAPSRSTGYDSLAHPIARSLVRMADLLESHGLIRSLAALLNLLTVLTLTLPHFIDSLLSISLPREHNSPKHPPNLLTVLCRAIPHHLKPDQLKGKEADGEWKVHADLAKELVSLLDAIIWSIPAEHEARPNILTRSAGVLTTLLDASQPKWFLRITTRLLSLLASRTNNFRHLMSFPEQAPGKAVPQHDYANIPHVEQMCNLLCDPKKAGPDADAMHRSIIITFTLLAMSHADALTILTESRSLIPSLIIFLGDCVTPLWEEDESLMADPARIDAMVQTTIQTLLLLHYLSFRHEPPLNLRQKINQARHFNGINHVFIVTLGRLGFGFSEVPEEVQARIDAGPGGRGALEQLAEIARDVMDLVVDGPESDSVWAVYHAEGDSDSEGVDEAEMEARLLVDFALCGIGGTYGEEDVRIAVCDASKGRRRNSPPLSPVLRDGLREAYPKCGARGRTEVYQPWIPSEASTTAKSPSTLENTRRTMLFPQINDDCCMIVLSLLNKPDLAILSRVSRLARSYAAPWLVRDLNIGKSAQFVNRGICRFVLTHGLGPYIQHLRISPSYKLPLGRCSLFGPIVDESLRLLADVVAVAINLLSFRIEPLYQGYLHKEPRLVIALQSRPRLRKLQITNVNGADIDQLISKPISNLRCLQLTLGDATNGGDVFDVVSSSVETLEELSIWSFASHEPQATHQAQKTICPRVRRLSLHNIRMDPYTISQAFPNLQHLKMNLSDYSDSPFTPSITSNLPLLNSSSFLELQSISGHSALTTLPLHSLLQRVHIEQLINSEEMLQDVLAFIRCMPLKSVSLLIRIRSPDEEARRRSGYNQWPLRASSVIRRLAKCIPRVQYLELGFSWAGFRASGRSPQVCTESILLTRSACRHLAALKELRYASFTVPGPRELGHDTQPNMQAVADDLFHTVPTLAYLTLRSKGWYTHLLHYHNTRCSGISLVEAAVPAEASEHHAVEITEDEAQCAYRRFSWKATGLDTWCAGQHEWE
ncbi:hypothetical protein EVG20_g1299 [Dentipellis fragilis]|uniref:Uncharacterized protein n=1 Tax=Dentipellis fragilis TaxID=205917 RepID=A0A4Y9ZCJ7_9AGAM|nr:hypothetical protein EVG20_g1299 [Dentipellis fragilis]